MAKDTNDVTPNPAETGANQIKIDTPRPGETKAVSLGENQQGVMEIDINSVEVELVDVDLVIKLPDGSKIALLDYGVQMMMKDSPQLIANGVEVDPQILLSKVNAFVESDLPINKEMSSEERDEDEDNKGGSEDDEQDEQDEEKEVVVEVIEVEAAPQQKIFANKEADKEKDGDGDAPALPVAKQADPNKNQSNKKDVASASSDGVGDPNTPVLTVANQSPVDENSEAGTVVASFIAIDEDAPELLTFALSGPDAEYFEIIDGEVVVAEGAKLNFEDKSSLEITIHAVDSKGLSSSEPLVIAVADVNEGPSLALENLTPVDENTPVGTAVASFEASDPDEGDQLTYSLSGPDAHHFEIKNGQIVVAEGADLDFETGPTRAVFLTVTDREGLSTTETLVVTLKDVEEAPELTVNNYTPIDENSGGGTRVATFSSEDETPDDPITYSLSGADAQDFIIVGHTIQVTSGADLDFEDATTREVIITATNEAGQTTSETVTVSLRDLNDEIPELTVNSFSPINENSPAGTIVARLEALDRDAGDELTFTLSGADAANYVIIGNEVHVAPGATLDFETQSRHNITVTVSDAVGHTDSESISIDLLDVNEAPEVETITHGPKLENSKGGTLIASFSSFDQDAGDSVTYSLAGKDADLFEIFGEQVFLRHNVDFDFEDGPTREFQVVATDTGGLEGRSTVLVNLLDYNDETPELVFTNLSPIQENVPAGTTIARFIMSDRDADDTLTPTLSGPDADLFEIIGTKIVLKSGEELDYEAGQTHNFTLTITDEVGHEVSEDVTVTLEDVNEPPELEVSVLPPINENSIGGTPVANYSASDVDAGDELTFTLTGPNANLFELVEGQIQVRDDAELDFEDGATRSVILRVTDRGGLFSQQSLTIELKDLNDETPELAVTNLSPIDENPTPGTPVARFVGSDADAGDVLSYALSGPDAGLFRIAGDQIVVASGADIDFEDAAQRVFTLTVTDKVGHTSSEEITILINNTFDEAPELFVANPGPINENSDGGTVVASFNVIDADLDDEITFKLQGPDAALFQIVGNEVHVRSGAELDFEASPSREFSIVATDLGFNSTSVDVTVDLLDINEAPELSTQLGQPINENSNPGVVVASFAANDPDAGDRLTYELSGPHAALFKISNGTIVVAQGADLDFEEGATREITLTATDKAGLSDSQTLVISLNDLNDEIPELSIVNLSPIAENSASDVIVANLSATDADAGDLLTYSLSGADAGLFRVIGNQIGVAPGADLDYEDGSSRTFTVTVTDLAGHTDSEEITINLYDLNDETPDVDVTMLPPINENSTGGTLVATFTATDRDAGDVLTYELEGEHSSLFEIRNGNGNSNSIVVANGADLDFEEGPTRNITLVVRDAVGNTYTENLTVELVDLNDETPELIISGLTAIEENTPAGSTVFSFTATDADADDVLDFRLEGPDASNFQISGGQVVVAPGADLDFENGPTRDFTLVVEDTAGHVTSQNILLDLVDLNDETPTMSVENLSPFNENIADDTVVAIFTMDDLDAGDILTPTLSGPDADKFYISDNEIRVVPGADTDYEAGISRDFTLTITDLVGHQISENVSIQLLDVNDESPEIDVNVTDPIIENRPEGFVVATFSATDADAGDIVTLTLEGPDAGLFVIDQQTNEIRLAPGAELDHEAAENLNFTIRAEDTANHVTTRDVSLTIGDENEVPHIVIDALNQIDENSMGGTVVAQFTASDPDDGDSFTLRLEGADAALFEIVRNEVHVRDDVDLDFEAGATRSFDLIAQDAAGLETVETITVDLNDLIDETPTLGVNNLSPIQETSEAGTLVATFSATDADAGDTLSYTLTGPDAGLFELTANNEIVIREGAVIDFETQPTAQITLTVADTAIPAHTDSQTMIIEFGDVNDEAPDVIVTNLPPINENSAPGTPVATFSSTDGDADDRHSHALAGTDAGLFQIVADQIQVAPGADLDFEDSSTRSIELVTTDLGGNITRTPVTISLVDLNDETPLLSVTNHGPIDENVPTGTTVLTLSATDADANSNFTYSIDGPDAAFFDVVGNQVVVRDGSNWDFEAGANRIITVHVSDGENSSSENVSIELANVNETPEVTVTNNSPIDENSAAGTVVASFVPSDPDAGDNLVYRLTGPDAGLFEIVGTDIVVASGADINFEADNLLNFALEVEDAGGLVVAENIDINVSDVNDAPGLTVTNLSPIDETAITGTAVATLVTADEDSADRFTYSITGPDAANFMIVGNEVQVAPGADIDFENGPTRSITITTTDAGNLSDSFNLTVSLVDINDELPAINLVSQSNVVENDSGITVASFTASDRDAEDATLTYSLEGADAHQFEIVGTDVVMRPGRSFDHEESETRVFTVVATDAAGHRAELPVTITVLDINEAPELQLTETLLTDENSGAGTVVARFVGTDEDDGDSISYSLGGRDAASFIVDGNTGEIRVADDADLDFEQGDTRSVILVAQDQSGLQESLLITIQLRDLNDETPELSVVNEAPQDENSAAGTVVARFSATDADAGDSFTYSLSGPDAATFEIDENNGTIFIAPGADYDYELGSFRQVTLTVSDAANPPHTDSQILIINLNDLNDETPELLVENIIPVDENAVAGTAVADVSASDADAGDTITYSVTGPDSALFEVQNDKLVVAAGADIDFENQTSLNVTVVAEDAVGHNVSQSVTISVNDLLDETPVLTIDSQNAINENSDSSTVVASFSSTDEDADDKHSYSLSGPDAGLFTIVDNEIRVAPGADIDFENGGGLRQVTLTVTDDGGLQDSIELSVIVNDLNDETPELSIDSQNNINENSNAGTTVATFSATDADAGDSLSYSLTGPDAASFEIVGNQIQVASGASIDFEDGATRSITLVVNDAADPAHTDSIDLTINLNDLNDEVPNVVINTQNPVAENSAAGTLVATFTGSDDDANDILSYSLTGPDAGLFTIVGNEIHVAAGADIDFEAGAVRSFTLVVTDDANNSSNIPLNVTITDVNEAPELTINTQSAVDENNTGASVATFSSSDVDAGDGATYSLSGADAALFEIVGNEIRVRNDADLDFENGGGTRQVTLIVTDDGGLQDSQDLTITVNDLNDETPILTVVNNTPIQENQPAGTVMASFTTQDADASNSFSYSLGGADASLFTIVGNEIQLASGQELNFEDGATRSVNLTVNDGGGNSSTESITFTLTNENESPELTIDSQNTIDENSAAGTVVATFTGTDPDAGDTQNYSLTGPDAGLFTVVGNQIQVATGADIDFENGGGTRSVTLVLQDDAGLRVEEALTITVNDLNDETPELSIDSQNNINENSNAGTTVATFSATDADAGDSLSYSLTGPDAASFEIVGNQIQVASGASIDFEDGATRSITLVVNDAADPAHTDSIDLTINLNDLNDEVPNVVINTQNPVAENSAAGTLVATFTGSDDDANDILSYSLTGPDAGLFTIVGNEIHVAAGADIDFEAGAVRSFTLVVTDDANNSSNIPLNVTITDVNEAPELTINTQSAVDENDNGAFVASFTGTDVDAGDDQTYSLSGAHAGLFEIVGNEIRVRAGADIDFENGGGTRQVTLIVTDDGGLQDSQDLTITVNDLNDETPILTVVNNTPIQENQPAGTVMASFTTADADANNNFTYNLSGADAALFTIVGNEIQLASGQELNFEDGATRSVNLTVNDGGGNSSTESITFTLTNENESPELTIDSQNTIDENSAAGTVVATFTGTDPDAGDTQNYSLTGPDAGLFTVVGNQIQVATGADIDFENGGGTRSVTLVLQDDAGLRVEEALTITVNDLNDETPELSIDSQNNINENSAGGTVVATFSATDADAGDSLSYSLSGADAGLFEIVGNEIRVKSGADIDFEDGATRAVTLNVADSADPAHTNMIDLTVNINDLNDETPELTINTQNSVDEDADGVEADGTLVATFSATDADAGDSLSYALSGPDAGLFTIVGNEIHVAAGADIDFEAGAVRSFTLVVTDDANNSSNIPLNVTITDVNEAPELTINTQSAVDENDNGAFVASFTGTDVDAGDDQTYSLSGAHAGLFEIVGNEIRVRVGADIDFENGGGTRQVTLIVTDDGGLQDSQDLTVTVNNLNDETPELSIDSQNNINENSAGGTIVATFSATDADAGDSLSYSLTGPDAASFEIVGNQIQVASRASIDFEDGATRSITLVVNDAANPAHTDSIDLTINLNDLNDEVPNVVINTQNPVAENSAAGTLVATFTGSDDDANDILSYSLTGPDAGLFTIVGNEIHVAAGADIDFEAGAVRSFTLVVTDDANNSSNIPLNVTITDVNEAPELTINTQSAVDENNTGASVATFSSSDVDAGDGATYSLSGADAALFEIVGNEIRVRNDADLDFENGGGTRQVTLIVTDDGGLQDSQDLTVTVNDLNDETPILTVVNNTPIQENQPAGTVMASFTTADADANNNFTYNLSGADAALFTIVGNEIQLASGQELDFEDGATRTVTLTVNDGGGNSSTESITFTLTNENESPELTIDSQNTIDENSAAGTVVATFTGTDPDAGDTQNYSLTGPDAGLFTVVGNQIQVATGADIDFENGGGTRSVTLVLQDDAGLRVEEALTITVNDLNDETPELSIDSQNNINENSAGGTVVATFSATDADAGDSLSYSLSGADAGLFEIVGNEIRVKSGADIDFEDGATRAVTLNVADSADPAHTNMIDLTVNINDLNDETPELTINTQNSVDEDADGVEADGTLVATFSATDADAGDSLSYALSGPDAGLFTIVGNEIHVAAGADIDFESATSHQITLTVSDSANPAHTHSVPLIISVNDVNEAPELTINTQSAVDENNTGASVATFSSSDVDAGDGATYSLSGADAALFEIVGNEIRVRNDADLDFENGGGTRQVTLIVTDDGGLQDSQDLTVTVNDLNDETPILTVVNNTPIQENQPAGTVMASFTTQDADASNNFTYNLSGADAALFTIVGNEIQLASGQELNFEDGATRSVNLTVNDGGGNSSTESITFTLTNENESPELTIDSQNTIDENSAAGTVVATFTGTDPDAGDTQNYSLTGPDAGLFTIVGNQIQVATGADIDFENGGGTRNVTLVLEDRGGLQATQPLTITVNDLNDETPTLNVTNNGPFTEDTASGTVIATFDAEDPDAGDTLTPSLSGTDAAMFEIVNNEIRLRTGHELDYEQGATRSFTLTIEDAADPAHTVSENIVVDITAQWDEVPELNGRVLLPNIDENSAAGTPVVSFTVNDADVGDSFTYLLSGTDANMFKVVGNEIQVNDGVVLDFETKNSFDVTLTVRDQGNNDAVQSYNININDVNEAPTMNVTNQSPIDEGVPPGTVVAVVTTNDVDAGDYVNVTLEGPDAALFAVSGGNIVVAPGVDLDYEEATTRSITIVATDNGGLETRSDQIIRLNNLWDEAPDMDITNLSALDENQPAGTPVARFVTTDADVGDVITYTLSGADAGKFQVVGDEIQLRPGQELNFEDDSSLDVTITATDRGSNIYTEDLVITLNDINDPPEITIGSNSPIDENSGGGTLIAVMNHTDEDGDSVTYSIQAGPHADQFQMVGNELRVAAGADLDFEDGSSRSVTIVANDGNGGVDSQEVIVTLNDLNDEIPVLTVSNNASIDENSATGAPVISFTATDADAADRRLNYTLTGPDASKFAVLHNTIVVADGADLDFEGGQTTFEVTLEVRDNASPAHMVSENITITVNDVNEAPEVTIGTPNDITENSTSGTVASFSFNDPDAGDVITSRIIGVGAQHFEIVGNEIRVKSDADLDYEDAPTIDVTVEVEDTGGLKDTETITVNIIDYNDESPELAITNNSPVTEQSANGTVAATFVASDRDFGDNVTVTLGGPDAGNFSLSGNSIVVSNGGNLIYDNQEFHQLTLTAVDDAGHSISETVTIQLERANNAPILDITNTNSVDENAVPGTVLSDFTMTDENIPDGDVVNFSLSGPNSHWFQIVHISGDNYQVQVADGVEIDYETASSFDLTLYAIDSEGLTAAKPIHVDINNQNDVPIIHTFNTIAIDENSAAGTLAANFTWEDEDADANVTFTLGGADADKFEVVGNQIVVKAGADLDYEEGANLEVTLIAQDQHGAQDSFTRIIRLLNLNDESPIVTVSNLSPIPEKSAQGTPVVNINASDPDAGDTLTYAISGPDAANFEIFGNSIVVAPNADLAFIDGSTRQITLTVEDAAGHQTTQDINIILDDQNESPILTIDSVNDIPEDSRMNTVVATFSVSDPDAGDRHAYALSGDYAGWFRIIGNQIVVAADGLLDHETAENIELTLFAQDSGGLSHSQPVNFRVTNVPEAPVIEVVNLGPFDEGIPAGTLVATYTIEDEDNPDPLDIQLTGPHAGWFTMENGEIRVAPGANTNYEQSAIASITIRVEDSFGLVVEEPIAIVLNDVDETPGMSITPRDPIAEDVGDASLPRTVAYFSNNWVDHNEIHTNSITGPDGDYFKVVYDSGSDRYGRVVIKSEAELQALGLDLDFETKPVLEYTVHVHDQANNTNSYDQTVNLTDGNDAAIITVNQPNAVPENLAGGAVLTDFTVSDQDGNDLHSYLLTGTNSHLFEVVGHEIRLKADAELDFESTPSFQLTLWHFDGSLQQQHQVDITITDVNEAPEIDQVNTTPVSEDAAQGVLVATFSASDPDAGDTISYSLGGPDADSFEIVGNTIVVAADADIDHDTNPTRTIELIVTDAGNLSSSQLVLVNLTDVGEAPTISLDPVNGVVDEHSAVGTVVGNLDILQGNDNETYNITLSGTDAAIFEVVNNEIRISDDAAFDFETDPTRQVTVTVEDNDGHIVSDSMIVALGDVDEDPVLMVGTSFTIDENSPNGTLITSFSSDNDAGETPSYSLTGADAAMFQIVGNEIQVANSAALDFETQSSFSITLNVDDGNGNTDSEDIIVNLNDLAEESQMQSAEAFDSSNSGAKSARVTETFDKPKSDIVVDHTGGNSDEMPIVSPTDNIAETVTDVVDEPKDTVITETFDKGKGADDAMINIFDRGSAKEDFVMEVSDTAKSPESLPQFELPDVNDPVSIPSSKNVRDDPDLAIVEIFSRPESHADKYLKVDETFDKPKDEDDNEEAAPDTAIGDQPQALSSDQNNGEIETIELWDGGKFSDRPLAENDEQQTLNETPAVANGSDFVLSGLDGNIGFSGSAQSKNAGVSNNIMDQFDELNSSATDDEQGSIDDVDLARLAELVDMVEIAREEALNTPFNDVLDVQQN